MNSVSRAAPRLAGMIILFVVAVCFAAAARAAPSASVVMDARSGEILFARNHDTRLHPASLTKMMTLYIVFEAVQNGEITMDTMVRISPRAAGEPCSCLGLRSGQTIALRYLVRAAAIRSANDASTAMAEAISGSEAAFAERMNRTARAMGMNNTTFRNAHGLTHPQHLSTARDMTILGRQLFFDYPQYYNLFSRRSTDAGIATVNNTNNRFLDAYRGADGIKTGYTRAAGFNLVGSAERGGKRIIATVFGGQSVAHRNAQMAELMDLGFSRAPAQVAVRRPATPAYQGGRTAVAAAPAPATPATAARTVRLETSLSRSPIPPVRPAGIGAPPETVLVAIAESVNAAVAEIAAPAELPFELLDDNEAERTPAVAAAPAPRPEDLPFAIAEAEALPDDGSDEQLADAVITAARALAAAPPRPEGLAPDAAAVEAEATLLAAAEMPAEDTDVLSDPYRSVELADLTAALQAAEAIDRAAGATPDQPLADAGTQTPDNPLRRPVGEGAAATVAQALELPQPGNDAAERRDVSDLPAMAAVSPPARDALQGIVLTSSVAPQRPVQAGMASFAPEPAAATPEVVSRTVSTSDARLWGVHLGRYPSRFEAERALIQTSLAEISTLEGAVRRIQQRQGGFEANFVGMSQETADLACRRLQARDRFCLTLAP